MVDIVVNHNGWSGRPKSVDYSVFNPFNNESYYHPYCAIDFDDMSNTVSGPPVFAPWNLLSGTLANGILMIANIESDESRAVLVWRQESPTSRSQN